MCHTLYRQDGISTRSDVGRKIGTRGARWSARAITFAIKARDPAYQNATARTPYVVVIIARMYNLSRVIIAPRLQIYRSLSNRAIHYSGRTYGNVYRQAGQSRIVNNNLRQCNHTYTHTRARAHTYTRACDIINVMNTYRAETRARVRANFAISERRTEIRSFE